MKHTNIALFVPHNGCPHACSFCSQWKITGQSSQPTPEDVVRAVETARQSLGKELANAELAFFGGSFTAIDRNDMTELLSAAAPYIRKKELAGIRISTRPDAIDEEILSTLRSFGVTAIELGAQSMCDEVLSANHRGHTSLDVKNASELIRQSGFSLGLQMMTGLYQSTPERDRRTAEQLADLHPDTIRIYPTVVLKGTELDDLYQRGAYVPQQLDEAVMLCAELLQYFEERNIRVIRLGLHDSESLRKNMTAGAYHPAFRELCESEILYRNALAAMKQKGIWEGTAEFFIHPSSVSRFVGQKRTNLLRLQQVGVTAVVRQDSRLSKYEVRCADQIPQAPKRKR